MRQRNYKIILTVTLGLLLSFSVAKAKNFTIYNATTPSQSCFTVNGTSGNMGIGTTTPTYNLDISGTFGAVSKSSSIIIDSDVNILIGI